MARAFDLITEHLTLGKRSFGMTASVAQGEKAALNQKDCDPMLADFDTQTDTLNEITKSRDPMNGHDALGRDRTKRRSRMSAKAASMPPTGSLSSTSLKNPRTSNRSARAGEIPRLPR